MTDDRVTAIERHYILGRIVRAIELFFCFSVDEGPYLDGTLLRDLIQRSEKIESRRAFTLFCKEFLATLKNGHTSFEDAQLFSGQVLPFYCRPIDGVGWTVIKSRDARIPPGSILKSIDRNPIEVFFAEANRYLNASSLRAAKANLFFQHWLFEDETEFAFEALGAVDVAKVAPSSDRTVKPTLTTSGDPASVLCIPSFAQEHAQEILALVREASVSPNLIIDIRGNGGGATPMELLRLLANAEFELWQVTTPLLLAASRLGPTEVCGTRPRSTYTFPPPTYEATAGPKFERVVVLQDIHTASAAEDFIMALRPQHHVTTIGEVSAGTSGQPYFEDFGNGFSMRIAAKGMSFPNGDRFEGIGLEPHLPVTLSAEDLRQGIDKTMDIALASLIEADTSSPERPARAAE